MKNKEIYFRSYCKIHGKDTLHMIDALQENAICTENCFYRRALTQDEIQRYLKGG